GASREHACCKGLGLRARHKNSFGTFCKLPPTIQPTPLIQCWAGIRMRLDRSHGCCGDVQAVSSKQARIDDMYSVWRLELEEIVDERKRHISRIENLNF